MAIQHAQERKQNEKTKDDPNNETIIKCVPLHCCRPRFRSAPHSRCTRNARLLTDKAFLESYVKELLPRINVMRARRHSTPLRPGTHLTHTPPAHAD